MTTPRLEIDGSIVSTGSVGPGQSGDIHIEAEQIRVENGGAIRSDTYGPGAGGTIQARDITLEGHRTGTIELLGGMALEDYPSEISSVTYTAGQAGAIDITTGRLNLDESFIATTSFGYGAAGHCARKKSRVSRGRLPRYQATGLIPLASGPAAQYTQSIPVPT